MSRPKTALTLRLLLVWLIVWPLVMAAQSAINHLAPSLPYPLRTFVLTGLLVPLIALVVAPLADRIVRRLGRIGFDGNV